MKPQGPERQGRLEKGKSMSRRIGIAGCLAAVLTLGSFPAIAQSGPAEALEVAPLRGGARGLEPVSLSEPSNAAVADIRMAVGKTEVLTSGAPVKDIIVADPSVADVVVSDPQNIYILGRRPGATNVFLLGADGQVVRKVDITVVADVQAALQMLQRFLPDASISLEPVGDGILMKGWVKAAQDAVDAERILSTYLASDIPGRTAVMVENRTTPSDSNTISFIESPPGASRAGGGDRTIINALRVVGDQQVLLQVRIAEVQRGVSKELSVNGSNVLFNVPLGGAVAAGVPTATLLSNSFGINDQTFQILETQNLVKILSEPALTAISGQTANFLAGGEFPVLTGTDANGNALVEFKDYGVSLSFTPVVLASNQISLRVATEFSQPDISNALVVNNIPVPGLNTRRADTTVVLPSGGSMMIGGLIQSTEQNTLAGVPFFKDLPVLGALFRSRDFQQSRTELMILVRVLTVRPIDFGAELALPTDGFVPASDWDIYVTGRLSGRYGRSGGNTLTVAGPIGYIME